MSWLDHHVRFESSGLYLLYQRVSSITYCQRQKQPQPHPSTKFLHSLPFSLPINCLMVSHPPPSINHCPSSKAVQWSSKFNDLLNGVLGEATSRIPDHRENWALTIRCMIPIAHRRGGYLSVKLLPRVRRHLGKTVLPVHLLAYSDGQSSRATHRKTVRAALFNDPLTYAITLLWHTLGYPNSRPQPHLGRCDVDQKSRNF